MSISEQVQSVITKRSALNPIPGTTGSKSSGAKSSSASGASDDFDTYMKALLSPDANGEVDEEEMFAALAQERVKTLKGDDAAKKFSEINKQKLEELKRPDGQYRVEDSARAALRELVNQKVITADEGNTIYSQAFNSAQLDDNKNVLFDGTGGPNDPTKAVAKLEAALLAARTMVDKVSKADDTSTKRTLVMDSATAAQVAPIEPKGTAMDGPEGFLWKPISQNQKRLAVLLPKEFTFNIDKVVIKDAAGKDIEEGKFSSIGEGGPNAREKFNFSKKGGDYPANSIVEMWTKDGQVVRWKIPDTAQRYE